VVVPGDQAQRGVAAHGLRDATQQHVHLARLQGGKALLGGHGRDAEFAGVPEHRGSNGTAQVGFEAAPLAFAVGHGKARHAFR